MHVIYDLKCVHWSQSHHLISLLKLIDEEVMIQDIPSPPMVVYLKDKETQAIIGIKVKEEDMFCD